MIISNIDHNSSMNANSDKSGSSSSNDDNDLSSNAQKGNSDSSNDDVISNELNDMSIGSSSKKKNTCLFCLKEVKGSQGCSRCGQLITVIKNVR